MYLMFPYKNENLGKKDKEELHTHTQRPEWPLEFEVKIGSR